MKRLEYSLLVQKKMRALKKWLTDHFDENTARNVVAGILQDADILTTSEKCGTSIAALYEIDTEYWYLFTHQHYLIYRIEADRIIIIQMFHEREDFMMLLFGISGRSQDSIDYWGE